MLLKKTAKMSAADTANPGKAAASHPPYLQMIKDAIIEIGNKKGSSGPAITKHLLAKYPDIDGERSRTYLRNAFRHGLKSEALVLARKEGKGAGSYKIAKVGSEKPKEVVKKKAEAPKKAAKKTAEGKVAKKVTPKKVKKGSTSDEVKTKKVAKKSVEKTTKSPAAKKGSVTKTGKSPAKPAKKVGKSPAAKKAAAKKATAKSPVAKKAAKK